MSWRSKAAGGWAHYRCRASILSLAFQKFQLSKTPKRHCAWGMTAANASPLCSWHWRNLAMALVVAHWKGRSKGRRVGGRAASWVGEVEGLTLISWSLQHIFRLDIVCFSTIPPPSLLSVWFLQLPCLAFLWQARIALLGEDSQYG